jgi:hypothetical protein
MQLAELTFWILFSVFAVMVLANVAVVLAKLLRWEQAAETLVRVGSRATWFFRLGADGDHDRRRAG